MDRKSPLNDYFLKSSGKPKAQAPAPEQPTAPESTPLPTVAPRPASSTPGSSRPMYLLIGLAVLVLLLAGYTVYLHTAKNTLENQLAVVDQKLALVDQRLDESDAHLADLRARFQVTTERLGFTQGELDRTRQMAAQIRKEQQERVQELTAELQQKAATSDLSAFKQQTSSTLGAISTDVSATQQKVAMVDKGVIETKEEVSKLNLKLSEYGTLIARNGEELAYLRRKGERDYFEFDMRKGSNYTVSDLRLKLRNTDAKDQRYHVEYTAGDRTQSRKRVNVNEPIQVYVGDVRQPYEIVVNRVYNDRVVGYVSAPKIRGESPGTPIK